MSRKKWTWSEGTPGERVVYCLGMAILVFVIVFGINHVINEEAAKSSQAVVVRTIDCNVTVGQLLDEYDANEVAADLKYKGKLIAVTGYVYNIARGGYATGPTVKLAPSQSQGWTTITVKCSFRVIQNQQVAQLVEGEQTTIVGICHGEGFLYIGVRECYILVEEGE